MKDKDIKNINKKNLICKTLKKPEKLSLPCNKSWENWVPKNELIFDFRGQSEVEYNRITIFY